MDMWEHMRVADAESLLDLQKEANGELGLKLTKERERHKEIGEWLSAEKALVATLLNEAEQLAAGRIMVPFFALRDNKVARERFRDDWIQILQERRNPDLSNEDVRQQFIREFAAKLQAELTRADPARTRRLSEMALSQEQAKIEASPMLQNVRQQLERARAAGDKARQAYVTEYGLGRAVLIEIDALLAGDITARALSDAGQMAVRDDFRKRVAEKFEALKGQENDVVDAAMKDLMAEAIAEYGKVHSGAKKAGNGPG